MLRAMYAISFDHAATTPVEAVHAEAVARVGAEVVARVGAEAAHNLLMVSPPVVGELRRAHPRAS